MSFPAAVSSCFQKYVVWQGRAPRSEYWYFYLFTVIVNIVASTLDGVTHTSWCSGLATLLLLLPTLSVMVRRLHDSDLSGWWLWLPLGLFLGMVVGMVVGIGGIIASLFYGSDHVGAFTSAGMVLLAGAVVLGLGGAVSVLVLMLRGSTPGPNRFGPHPFSPAPLPVGYPGHYPPYGGPTSGYGAPQDGSTPSPW